MTVSHLKLSRLQKLVIDITKTKRNHTFPDTDTNENVVEHSFSVAMLCWRVFTEIQPNLSLERIFKYALAHDFLERGLRNDVNTYASPAERNDKESYERAILKQLSVEFSDFDDMILVIQDYENQIDEESRFVKTIDKMQAIILGELDEWRPYAKINVSHQEFTEKGESFLDGCPDCLKETLSELNKHTRTTFYDQPVS